VHSAKASDALDTLVLWEKECFEKTAKNRSTKGGGHVNVLVSSVSSMSMAVAALDCLSALPVDLESYLLNTRW